MRYSIYFTDEIVVLCVTEADGTPYCETEDLVAIKKFIDVVQPKTFVGDVTEEQIAAWYRKGVSIGR
ncbi:hypothetical protein [Bacillus phage Nachito]|nr:hypothetical protein [Bacillus phage Nachito]